MILAELPEHVTARPPTTSAVARSRPPARWIFSGLPADARRHVSVIVQQSSSYFESAAFDLQPARRAVVAGGTNGTVGGAAGCVVFCDSAMMQRLSLLFTLNPCESFLGLL